MFAVTLELSTALKKGNDLLERLCRIQSSDHINRIKKWLLFDVDVDMQHAKNKLGAQYLKSGKWLLDLPSFKTWVEDSQGQFWIQGAVGTGKTSLVSIIIDLIRPQRANVAFYYCTDNALQPLLGSSSYLTKILRAIIGQLALSPDDRRVAEEVEIRFDKAVSHGMLRTPEPLVQDQAKELLIDLINSRHDTTIIIDGLDECPSFIELLGMLQEISSRTRNLKFLFSSQYVVPVDKYFPLTEKAVAGGKDCIPDMRSFIEGEVQKFKTLHPDLLDDTLSNDIVETLSEKAEGMFKWAQLCLKLVLDREGEETASEIDANWKSVKNRRFQGLMGELIRTYEDLYNSSLPSGPSGQQKRLKAELEAERTLLWVLGASQPLTQDEYFMLQDDISPDSNRAGTERVSKLCRNFLYLSDNGTIVLAHSSVQDYLSLKLTKQVDKFLACEENSETAEEAQRSILDQAQKSLAQLAKMRISKECLTIILDANTKSSTEDTQNLLLVYACKDWFKHVNACMKDGKIPDSLLGQIEKLFDPSNSEIFRKWLSVYDPDQSDGYSRAHERPPDPLYYATLMGFPEIARSLLEKGANPSSRGGRIGYPLQLACYKGQMSVVSMMLDHGANVNKADYVLGTPLQAAIAGGNSNVAMELMDKFQAGVDARGGPFGNALQTALALDNQPLLRALVAHGARYNDKTGRGRIWAEVWKTNPAFDREFTAEIMKGIKAVSELKSAAQGLPKDLNLRVKLLSICVYCPQWGLTSIDRYLKPCRPKVRAQLTRKIWERIHEDDFDSVGFVPAKVPWLLLVLFPLTWEHMATLYDMLDRHESFLQTFDGQNLNLDLDKLLVSLFAGILETLLSYISKSRAFRIIIKLPVRSDRMKELQDLDEAAKRLEDSLIATMRTDQALAARNEDLMIPIRKIADDISDMKREIRDLTEAVRLLATSQQKFAGNSEI